MKNPDFDQLSRSFEEQGYVLTAKRKSIVDYICAQEEIADIEEVWMTLREKEKISWATVYTSVKVLKRLGWVEACEDGGAYRWVNP
ncbi:MAG: transcriptional repressor [Sphingobacterium sp.]|nr:transcriptional repressor [Sphingobacterium sp.]